MKQQHPSNNLQIQLFPIIRRKNFQKELKKQMIKIQLHILMINQVKVILMLNIQFQRGLKMDIDF